MRILLSEIFDPQSIRINLESTTKDGVFTELVEAITNVRPECDAQIMLDAIWEREKKMSTGIVSGVAIPHAVCRGINKIVGAIGLSEEGIDYNALDHNPVHVVFMLLMGEPGMEGHLRVFNQLTGLIKSDSFLLMRQAKNPEEIKKILTQFNST
jgi:PTS system fructose-specific IIC component/PTS system nitrogen regulatory IIA component